MPARSVRPKSRFSAADALVSRPLLSSHTVASGANECVPQLKRAASKRVALSEECHSTSCSAPRADSSAISKTAERIHDSSPRRRRAASSSASPSPPWDSRCACADTR